MRRSTEVLIQLRLGMSTQHRLMGVRSMATRQEDSDSPLPLSIGHTATSDDRQMKARTTINLPFVPGSGCRRGNDSDWWTSMEELPNDGETLQELIQRKIPRAMPWAHFEPGNCFYRPQPRSQCLNWQRVMRRSDRRCAGRYPHGQGL